MSVSLIGHNRSESIDKKQIDTLNRVPILRNIRPKVYPD